MFLGLFYYGANRAIRLLESREKMDTIQPNAKEEVTW